MIHQTIAPNEIVLVKDGVLTKELEEVLEDYSQNYSNQIKIVGYSENQGLWYALRFGMNYCSNEFIARMDTDDYCLPTRIEQELYEFQKDPKLDCVGSNVVEFVDNPNNIASLVVLPEDQEEIIAYGKRRCPFRHPTLLYRKSVVENAGGYQEMPMFEDYDLYMRMIKNGAKFKNIQEFLVYMGTDSNFFQRRGSVDYLKKMVFFRRQCLRRKDVNLYEFITSIVPHAIVCLVPNVLRSFFYRNFLRKKPSSIENEY